MTEELNTYELGRIYNLVDYHPYRKFGEDNPDRDSNTYKIMDLKNPSHHNHKKAVDFFGHEFKQGASKFARFHGRNNFQVAIVPSSKVGKLSLGLEGVLSHVTGVNLLYNRDFLVRTRDIPSAHEGGERSIQQHKDTIAVNVKPNPNIPLLLVDDVTTTGASLEACKQILEAAGVKEVYMVAIGTTV
ncbi:ComF family protein [Vibrio campbellii]|uniref:ComF family protein n=1 Tax=Vibrio campbellii TaxID=680 RepID=UPI00168D610A|nr:hypothetical protein [Vibrio campbellii]